MLELAEKRLCERNKEFVDTLYKKELAQFKEQNEQATKTT